MSPPNSSKPKEIKKAYLLVHPFYGYYGGGQLARDKKTQKYTGYLPVDPNTRFYRERLELEWAKQGPERTLSQEEINAKKSELTAGLVSFDGLSPEARKGFEERFGAGSARPIYDGMLRHQQGDADLKFKKWFYDKSYKHPSAKDIEIYARKAKKLYKGAINEASKRKDSVFVTVSTPSVKITALPIKHSQQLTKRTHEYGLLKYSKDKLGKRSIVLQEHFSPTTLFKVLNARGYKLSPNVEVEGFGEVGTPLEGYEQIGCVPDAMIRLGESLPEMRKSVETGSIRTKKKEPPPEGGFDSRDLFTAPKAVDPYGEMPNWLNFADKTPKKNGKDLFWINLSRNGIPLKNIERFSRKVRHRKPGRTKRVRKK